MEIRNAKAWALRLIGDGGDPVRWSWLGVADKRERLGLTRVKQRHDGDAAQCLLVSWFGEVRRKGHGMIVVKQRRLMFRRDAAGWKSSLGGCTAARQGRGRW